MFLHNIVEEKLIPPALHDADKKVLPGDWIDLERLFALDRKEFMDPLTERIFEDILEDQLDAIKYGPITLIGLNYYGAILASVIGYKYNIPFTYCFDDRNIVDEIENELHDMKSNHLIIITDVMVTGKTIYSLVNSLCGSKLVGKDTRIDVIVLFERKSKDSLISMARVNTRIRDIYILNDDFEKDDAVSVCERR